MRAGYGEALLPDTSIEPRSEDAEPRGPEDHADIFGMATERLPFIRHRCAEPNSHVLAVVCSSATESDRMLFGWGQRASIRVSETRLHLVG